MQAGIVLKALIETTDREIFEKARRRARRAAHACDARRGASIDHAFRGAQVVASTDSTFSAERVDVLLRETAQLGVRTRAQCLVHLGKHFRAVRARERAACLLKRRQLTAGLPPFGAQVLDAPASRDDMAVGEQLLRELIFVHLERGADKFALLILMLRKLYALVRPARVAMQDRRARAAQRVAARG